MQIAKKEKLIVFTDFDGTITLKDLGDEIFIRFGDFDKYHDLLVNGKIDIKTYWIELCKTFDERVSDEKIAELALRADIDPYFVDFVYYLESEEIPLFITSDGFKSYIKPILERENISNIKFYCNELKFDQKGVYPIFPGATESCNCMAASCKRNRLLNNSEDDSIIVYIGDGYSDFCAAEHSDIIFAKKNLAAYCNEKRIPHYPYKNFFDVKRIMKSFIENNKLKNRNDAVMKRKRAFEIE